MALISDRTSVPKTDESDRRVLVEHANTTLLDEAGGLVVEQLPGGPQVRFDGAADLAINVQRVERGVAV